MILHGADPTTQPSFSLRNRVARGVWELAWLLLFRPSPRTFHAWRRLLLRLFGATLGEHVNVYPGARIWAPWQLVMGDRVIVGNMANIYNMAPIFIGSGCVISQGAHLCAGSHDIDSPNFQLITRPIVLEPDVWICTEAFVGPGVSIPSGCVIGARSVITRSVKEPWSVWVGNPASLKRYRTANRGCGQAHPAAAGE